MSKEEKDAQKSPLPAGLSPESDLPPDADVEERFNEFWKKNGAGVFGGIALGAVVVIGIQLFQYMNEKKEDAIRDAFSEATTIEQKLQFAEDNEDHQLAGLALLQVADQRYSEGDFAEAADLYASSSQVFFDSTLASRATLGQGMSLLQSGNKEAGQAVLRSIALDAAALDQTRGEAAYHLAISYWETGENEKAREMTDVISQLNAAPFWVYRANLLSQRLK